MVLILGLQAGALWPSGLEIKDGGLGPTLREDKAQLPGNTHVISA